MAERKTASELGITDSEYNALLWVRDAIDPEIPDTNLPSWIVFDMRDWGTVTSGPVCGTAACIGGSMAIYMAGLARLGSDDYVTGKEALACYRLGESLSALFNPLFFNYPGVWSITRPTTVAAIDRFLSGSVDDPWLTNLDCRDSDD